MNDISLQPSPVLPHHKLLAYGVARQLLQAVLACRVRDAKLREHAVRSAKSACLNCAEGAGRVTRADLKIPHIFRADPERDLRGGCADWSRTLSRISARRSSGTRV